MCVICSGRKTGQSVPDKSRSRPIDRQPFAADSMWTRSHWVHWPMGKPCYHPLRVEDSALILEHLSGAIEARTTGVQCVPHGIQQVEVLARYFGSHERSAHPEDLDNYLPCRSCTPLCVRPPNCSSSLYEVGGTECD